MLVDVDNVEILVLSPIKVWIVGILTSFHFASVVICKTSISLRFLPPGASLREGLPSLSSGSNCLNLKTVAMSSRMVYNGLFRGCLLNTRKGVVISRLCNLKNPNVSLAAATQFKG